MREVIDRLLASCPGARPEFFESSDWFHDASPETISQAITDLERHFDRRLATLVQLLGIPAMTKQTHGDPISRWYPEAIHAACWAISDKTICFALEHHDREAPVAVVLRCVTGEEIDDLTG